MIKLNNISDIRTGYNLRSVDNEKCQTVLSVSAKDLATNYAEASKVDIPSSFNSYLRDGDILVKSRGTDYEARVFRSRCQKYSYIATNTLIIVRLKTNDYRPAYIAQLINSESAQRFLYSLSFGSVLPVLSPVSLGLLSCPKISLDKQKEFEDITEIVDEYRECLVRYQKASEQLTKAIKQQFMKGAGVCR